jgi:hypothetical protein
MLNSKSKINVDNKARFLYLENNPLRLFELFLNASTYQLRTR